MKTMKQKAATTKIDGFWDYEGSHMGTDFRVRKNRKGKWEGEADIVDMEATANKKRDVVNDLVDQIEAFEEGSVNDEPVSYEDDMYSGVPMFSVELVKERDYTFAERTKVSTPADLKYFLKPYFANRDREIVVLVLLDVGNSVIGIHELSVGGLSSSVVDIRSIFKTALLANANSIMLAHNHPSGNTNFSQADIKITRKVRDAGETMDIELHDHLLFADDVVSMREQRLF